MAINYPNFLNAPVQKSGVGDIFANVLKGFQMQREPAKIAEEQKQRELANQLRSMEVEHKPKEYELSDAQKSLANAMQEKALASYDERFGLDKRLKEAQIKAADKPTALKGALAAAFQLRNNLDPNNPNYNRDVNAINNYINKLGQGANGEVSVMPGQGAKINLPEGKEGYIAGLGKLKSGWQPVKDAQGNDIGVNVPMTDKQVDQWKAKEKFDVIYPFINDSLSHYSGQNSWENFTRDAKAYNTDEAAKERVDNFMAARKLMSIASTTENARIGGHATNVQLRELKKSLDSSEVHNKLEQGSGFILPEKYAKASGDIFKSYLDKVETAAKTNIPAYEFRALNPQDNAKAPPLAVSKQAAPEVVSVTNGVATVRNGNKVFKIPENLVDRYILEHSPSALGGDYGQ